MQNWPVRYISFRPQPDLEKSFYANGFTDVKQAAAVDGEALDLNKEWKQGRIATNVLRTIHHGRSDHADMPTKGALGCFYAHAQVWREVAASAAPYTIICEDDIILYDTSHQRLTAIHKELMDIYGANPNTFALLYKMHVNNPLQIKRRISKEFDAVTYHFGMACYVVTPTVCQTLLRYAYPVSEQVDCYIGSLAYEGVLDMVNLRRPLGRLRLHASTTQDALCVKCYLPSHPAVYIGLALAIVALLVAMCVLVWKRRNKKSS